jgi:hypothetical protein
MSNDMEFRIDIRDGYQNVLLVQGSLNCSRSQFNSIWTLYIAKVTFLQKTIYTSHNKFLQID